MKKIINKYFLIVLILLVVVTLFWFWNKNPAGETEKIISRNGIHWHAELLITILGKKYDIPANIGLGVIEQYIHTHEADGIIHMEFPGLVKENELKLGRFFEIWGKEFNKDCIFDKCNGSEGQLKMLVNSKPNLEFENYIMGDGDKTEIIFE